MMTNMNATQTLLLDPTTADLVGLIGYYRSDAEVEAAGFAFSDSDPVVGEVVALHSRGGYRRAVVTHVTKTGTVTATYVTEGGLRDAEKIVAMYAAQDVEAYVDRVEAQDRRNHAWTITMADGTADHYRRFASTYGPERKAEEMAKYQAEVDAVQAQGGIEARLADLRPRRVAIQNEAKALTVLDRVGSSNGKAKRGKVARLA